MFANIYVIYFLFFYLLMIHCNILCSIKTLIRLTFVKHFSGVKQEDKSLQF